MKKFAFGELRETCIGKRTVMNGQFALHLQCSWRLLSGSTVISTSQDLYTPSRDEDTTMSLDSYRGNMSDHHVTDLFMGRQLSVTNTTITDDLEFLTLNWTENIALEVSVDESNEEQWRLFEPGTRHPHLVIERIDGDLVTVLEE